MKNNVVVFKFLEDGEYVPPGSQWIPFDMKAQYATRGHWTDAPMQLRYSSVIIREVLE